ncbi:condensin complex subunit 1-like [Asterias amurensis]|uniref:condensin complex subunit 1-like n=1 Tax=Asterias amurensis TaxID=7602 RepID=UPI003AB8824A
MSFEFVLPLSHKDLLQSRGTNQYVVEEVYPARQVPDRVYGCKTALRTEGPSMILDHFDGFYSLLRHFNEVKQETKEDAWELLLKAQQQLTTKLSSLLDDPEGQANAKQHLNTLKMVSYLLCQTAEAFEADACKPSTDTTVRGGRGRTKSKKTAAGWDWEAEKERFLQGMFHLLQLEVWRLWDPPIVEEEFVNLVSCCCYKLLENPLVGRNAGTKEALFSLLGLLIKRYNHTLGASLKIIQLLQHFEHLVSPMAQGVQTIVAQFGAKNIVSEIMRELGSLDPYDLARDNSGTRSYAAFLVELSEKIPSLMLPSISLLLCHLDGESYTMRNGVLGVLGEIVIQVLSKDGLDKKAKNTRDQLLDKLEDHIHDINAFSRSRVLQVWLHLCREKAIPLPRQRSVMSLTLGRLQDKSSIVRKNAVQLLSEFLTSNPFAAKLPVNELEATLEKEEEKLKAMMPDEPLDISGDVHGKTEEMWQAMEPELTTIVMEHLEEDAEDDEEEDCQEIPEDATVESINSTIRELLDKSQHRQALRLLRSARSSWPDYKLFIEPTPVFSPLDGEEEDEDEAQVTQAQLLATLKAVYLGEKQQEPQDSDSEEVLNLQDVNKLTGKAAEGDGVESVVNELTKQQVLVKYLQDCVTFAAQIQQAVPILCELLSSKINSDVLEAIEFFVRAHEFGVMSALEGIRRMMVLVWSKEQGVKDAVVAAYKRLYLNPQGGTQRSRSLTIVKSLMNLTFGARLGELTSLEELLGEFMKSDDVPAQAIQILWEHFTKKHSNTTEEESKAALVILGMTAGADMSIVRSNIDLLVSEGLGERGQRDFILARDTCLALLKTVKAGKPKVLDGEEPFRFPADHQIFTRLSTILITGVSDLEKVHWLPLAEQAVNTIYRLAEHPDTVCGDIVKKLAAAIIKAGQSDEVTQGGEDGETQPEQEGESSASTSCPAGVLSRFLAFSGHVALAQLVHLDVMVSGEMKRRHNIQDKEKEKKDPKDAAKGSVSGEQASIEDEMGLGGAAVEDAEAEYIRKICESELVTGHNLLSAIRPLLVMVCSNPVKYNEPGLRAASSLALAKFMLVSSDFCEAHLQLLFTILEKAPQPVIRANLIIALGDLTFRFPNLIEPWTPNLYARLRDSSSHVRKNTLMVLTHLILNDMVKVKGQISEMASCIVDPEERIAALAKLFFFELSKKGNAIYNVMPDMISRLSDPENGMDQEQFKLIMRYVFAFIQKDRQAESLVEKLCHRFRATRTDRQPQDLAFCLNLLNMSEKCIRRLQENFACFADKLHDTEVYSSFSSILSKAKKFAKPEMKVIVDDFEQKLNECHTKGVDDEAVVEKASKASAAARARANGGRSAARKKNGKRRGRGKSSLDSDEEDEDEDTVATPAPSRRPGQTPRQTTVGKTQGNNKKGRRVRAVTFSSDEDDSDDDFFVADKGQAGSKESSLDSTEEEEDMSDSENRDPNRQTPQEHGKMKRLHNTKEKTKTPLSSQRRGQVRPT